MSTGDDGVWFYRTPFTARRDGINFVGFSVGNFAIYSKLDRNFLSDYQRSFGSAGKKANHVSDQTHAPLRRVLTVDE